MLAAIRLFTSFAITSENKNNNVGYLRNSLAQAFSSEDQSSDVAHCLTMVN